MSPVAFLMLAVVIIVVGCGILYLRNRTPTSYESSVDNFRKEMQALAPRDEEATSRHWWRR